MLHVFQTSILFIVKKQLEYVWRINCVQYHQVNWSKLTQAAASEAECHAKSIYLFFKLFENNGKTINAEAKFQLKVLAVIFLIKNT